MYDHYGSGFSNCDKFNKCIHGKTWPFKLQGDKRVNSNYIFTCILINTYHLWIDSAHVNEDRSSLQWQEFCHDLAFEMISQKNSDKIYNSHLVLHVTFCLFYKTPSRGQLEFKILTK